MGNNSGVAKAEYPPEQVSSPAGAHQLSTPKPMKLRNRRTKLYEAQQGKCIWCKQQMLLISVPRGSSPHPRMATIEHLEDSWTPNRNKAAIAAACYSCNHKRNKTRQLALSPSVKRITSQGRKAKDLGDLLKGAFDAKMENTSSD